MAFGNAPCDVEVSLCHPDVVFSEELVFESLTWLPGASAHFLIATCCRNFRTASESDDLWVGRLTQSFPRVSLQGKRPGSFRIMYKILTKAHTRHFMANRVEHLDGTQDERPESWWRLMTARPASRPMGRSQVQLRQARASFPQLAACACAAALEAQRRGGTLPIAVTDATMQRIIADRRAEAQAAAAVLEMGGGVTRAVAVFEETMGIFAGSLQSTWAV